MNTFINRSNDNARLFFFFQRPYFVQYTLLRNNFCGSLHSDLQQGTACKVDLLQRVQSCSSCLTTFCRQHVLGLVAARHFSVFCFDHRAGYFQCLVFLTTRQKWRRVIAYLVRGGSVSCDTEHAPVSEYAFRNCT